jgi:NitT/TauT family transport system substrate-binding protein
MSWNRHLSVVVTILVILAVPASGAIAQEKKTKITLGIGQAMVYMAAFVADGAGYFKGENLDVDMVPLASGSQLTAALVGGSVDVIMLSPDNIIRSANKGLHLRAFASMYDAYPNSIALSNKAIEKAGITDSMSTDEKIKRLAGLRIGISTPGSGADQFIRTLLKMRGMNPDTDLTIQPFGDGAGMLAAVESGVADGASVSPPWSDLVGGRGIGKIIIDPSRGDVPEYNNFPFIVLAALPGAMERDRDMLTRMTRAIAKAIKLVRDHPDEGRRVTRKYFSDMEETLFDASYNKMRIGLPKKTFISEDEVAAIVKTMNISSTPSVTANYQDIVYTDIAKQVDAEVFGP